MIFCLLTVSIEQKRGRVYERKKGNEPIDSVVYLDSVDAVKAPVARADELDPIDLLEELQ